MRFMDRPHSAQTYFIYPTNHDKASNDQDHILRVSVGSTSFHLHDTCISIKIVK